VTTAPVAFLLLLGFAARGCATPANGPHAATLTLPAQWVVSSLFVAAAVSWIFLLVSLILLPRTAGWIAGRWGSQLALLLAMFMFCRSPFAIARKVVDERDVPRLGRLAVVADLGMGGHLERLGRIRSSGLLMTTYEVLAVGVDEAMGGCTLIRPATPAPHIGQQMFVTDGDVVAYVGVGGRCQWIYDGATGKARIDLHQRNESPFTLLDESTPGVERDLDALVAEVARVAAAKQASDGDSAPAESSMLDALGHANPWIRTAAHRIIGAGGAALYPEGMRRIAAGPK